jgi:hypothetical protein
MVFFVSHAIRGCVYFFWFEKILKKMVKNATRQGDGGRNSSLWVWVSHGARI